MQRVKKLFSISLNSYFDKLSFFIVIFKVIIPVFSITTKTTKYIIYIIS